MRIILKKYRILFIILILVILIISVPSMFSLFCKNRTEINNTTIDFAYTDKGLIIIHLENGKSFFIDSGSGKSFIFNDRLKTKPNLFRNVYLINPREKRIFLSQKIDSLQIGNLLIKNHDFTLIKSEKTIYKNDTNIVGMIGMDILSQKYCYFDIKNQTITFSDKKKTQTEPPFFVFSYNSSSQPLSDMTIDGNIFKDVLFDTGFNSFMIIVHDT